MRRGIQALQRRHSSGRNARTVNHSLETNGGPLYQGTRVEWTLADFMERARPMRSSRVARDMAAALTEWRTAARLRGAQDGGSQLHARHAGSIGKQEQQDRVSSSMCLFAALPGNTSNFLCWHSVPVLATSDLAVCSMRPVAIEEWN